MFLAKIGWLGTLISTDIYYVLFIAQQYVMKWIMMDDLDLTRVITSRILNSLDFPASLKLQKTEN